MAPTWGVINVEDRGSNLCCDCIQLSNMCCECDPYDCDASEGDVACLDWHQIDLILRILKSVFKDSNFVWHRIFSKAGPSPKQIEGASFSMTFVGHGYRGEIHSIYSSRVVLIMAGCSFLRSRASILAVNSVLSATQYRQTLLSVAHCLCCLLAFVLI